MKHWRSIVIIFLLAFGWSGQSLAAGVPLKMVQGHVLVEASITNPEGESLEVMLEVALERPEGLILHSDAFDVLVGDKTGTNLRLAQDIQQSLPFDQIVRESNAAREQAQGRLTRFHSGEMGEKPLKGSLGLGFFRQYRLILDVSSEMLELRPPGGRPSGQFTRKVEIVNGQAWIAANLAGEEGRVLLGTADYDSIVDAQLMHRLGRAGGEVSFRLGGSSELPIWELGQEIALRPRSLAEEGIRDGEKTIGRTGVGLLELFSVDVDWSAGQISFTRRNDKPFPQVDRDYFAAEASGDPRNLIEFLKRYPKHRRAAEAAQVLMQVQVARKASDEELVEALQWIADTALPRRELESCMPSLRAFARLDGRRALVVRAGELAMKYSRTAITIQDIYRLHALMGEALFKEGDLEAAWKHFLSAAFVPLDNDSDRLHNTMVNMYLARIYEQQGRYARAYSRYLKAQGLIRGAAAGGMPEIAADWKSEIDQALVRLRPQIPADNLVLLEG
ncbi:hypothetical protein [Pseudoxanthomonas putridarboris]|uniref:Tetratricopeptide repeat-containing protein n=1 Tax=Pseudoxanthomonas putridarboris TaxID=752605 RepID=A0ABU9IXY7_9GAMM